MISDLAEAVDRLGAAFLAQDVAAALDCFVPGEDITYVGSEAGERASGRAGLVALFGELFARPEAYTWRIRELSAHRYGDLAYLLAEVDGAEVTADGTAEEFGYRLSGLLELVDGGWRWRVCQGSEPSVQEDR